MSDEKRGNFKPGPDGVDREMFDDILAVLDNPGNEHTTDECIDALYKILGVKRPDWHSKANEKS